jgi:hypothetical protein
MDGRLQTLEVFTIDQIINGHRLQAGAWAQLVKHLMAAK